MAAIITDDFRRNSTAFLIDDIKDAKTEFTSPNNVGFEYFIGIGKSDSWDNDANGNAEASQNFVTPLPDGSVIESKEVLDNLIGAVAIKAASAYYVIPRNNWTATRRYKRWNENDPTMFDVETVGANTYYPCYTIHDDKIYICLDNDSNDSYGANNNTYVPAQSQNAPSGTSSARDAVQTTSDGYIWAYVADLNTTSEFNTDQFVSIDTTATGGGSGATAAGTATGGMVYGFEIVNPGSGVSGTGAGNFLLHMSDSTMQTAAQLNLTATITGGSVTGIVMSGGTTPAYFKANAKGVERATVSLGSATVTGNNPPVIRALVAPAAGFGAVPTQDLPSFYAGLAVNYNGDVEGELPTSVSYRQISLLRNPTRNNDDSPAPSGDGTYALNEVYNALRSFTLSGTPNLSSISAGDVITDVSTGLTGAAVPVAKAFVDYVDDANDKVYFHQNESALINQADFTTGNGSTSKISIGGTTYTYTSASLADPEYTPRTGEVMFLENRKPIQRAASQEEEIKLVIQF